MSAGRPTKYKPEYCQQIVDFFDVEPFEIEETTTTLPNGSQVTHKKKVAIEYPMLIDFVMKIGVSYDAIQDWNKKYPDFNRALKSAKKFQEKIIVQNAFKNRYDKTFSIFALKNISGWRDTQHNVNNHSLKLEVTTAQAKQISKYAGKKNEKKEKQS